MILHVKDKCHMSPWLELSTLFAHQIWTVRSQYVFVSSINAVYISDDNGFGNFGTCIWPLWCCSVLTWHIISISLMCLSSHGCGKFEEESTNWWLWKCFSHQRIFTLFNYEAIKFKPSIPQSEGFYWKCALSSDNLYIYLI